MRLTLLLLLLVAFIASFQLVVCLNMAAVSRPFAADMFTASTTCIGNLLAFWCVFGGKSSVLQRFAVLTFGGAICAFLYVALKGGLLIPIWTTAPSFAASAVVFVLVRNSGLGVTENEKPRLQALSQVVARLEPTVVRHKLRLYRVLPFQGLTAKQLLFVEIAVACTSLCIMFVVTPQKAWETYFPWNSIFVCSGLVFGTIVLPLLSTTFLIKSARKKLVVSTASVASGAVFYGMCGVPWWVAFVTLSIPALWLAFVWRILAMDGYRMVWRRENHN